MEMYDGFLVNVVDGPVSTCVFVLTLADTCGTHLVCGLFNIGHSNKGGWEHSGSVSPSGTVPHCVTICENDVY